PDSEKKWLQGPGTRLLSRPAGLETEGQGAFDFAGVLGEWVRCSSVRCAASQRSQVPAKSAEAAARAPSGVQSSDAASATAGADCAAGGADSTAHEASRPVTSAEGAGVAVSSGAAALSAESSFAGAAGAGCSPRSCVESF